jgi:CheY-like chemotaxis protein
MTNEPRETFDAACPTVLVIDDDPVIRESLEALLEAHGYQVALARNGRQGLAAFRKIAPDLVLTDIMMPEQDGFETILQMRMERAEAKIVAMSGSGGALQPDYLAMAVKLGADRGIEKLCHAEALLSELQGLLAAEAEPTVSARAA